LQFLVTLEQISYLCTVLIKIWKNEIFRNSEGQRILFCILCNFRKIELLKVVSGEKEGGLGVFTFDRYWSGTVALGIKKIREFAVVF